MNAPSVVFVDDEGHLLAGIRRMVRGLARDWDVRFAQSGAEALQMLAERPADAIVSDMRMPGLDGAGLLTEVQRQWPATARLVLSGQADRESVLAAAAAAHQFLAKPCDAETLVGAVNRVLAARRTLADPALRDLIGGVANLPTLPAVYHELVTLTAEPDCDIEDVVRVLASDVATSAEVLKLANSAFFGVPRTIDSVGQAVTMLGLDNIRALVLTGTVFRSGKGQPGADVEELRRIALLRAAMVRRIGSAESWQPPELNPVVLAGMLRDVGALVLAEGRPAEAAALAATLADDPALHEAPARVAEMEEAAYGCTVPQASAYLLGLWGFMSLVVHAVAAQPVHLEAGVSLGEQLLAFVHQRAVRPGSPVLAAEAGMTDEERAARWNTLCDSVLAETDELALARGGA